MSESPPRWGRWVVAITGIVLLFKSFVYVLSRLVALFKNEVQARDGEVAFALRMASGRREAARHS